MNDTYIGISSNFNREINIHLSLSYLQNFYGCLIVSPIYKNKDVKKNGDFFYNLVVNFSCPHSIIHLSQNLNFIETKCGRKRNTITFKYHVDIDLLLFGNNIVHSNSIDIPRSDILKYPFVLKPLVDIAGEKTHPETGKTFKAIWNTFPNKEKHPLTPIDPTFIRDFY